MATNPPNSCIKCGRPIFSVDYHTCDACDLAAPPPAGAQQAVALTEEMYCDLQFADEILNAIATRTRQTADVLEPVNDIRIASRLAKAAHARLRRTFTAMVPLFDATLAAPAAAQGAVSAEDQWIEQTRHLNCPACNGSGHVEDVLPQGDAAQRALLELLLLKDMKDKWEAEELSGFAYKSTDNHRLHNEQRANYLRRKPLAWEAARKAVAATPAPETAPPLRQPVSYHLQPCECEICSSARSAPAPEAAPSAKEREADTARLDWIVRQGDEFSCSVIVDAPGDGEYRVYGMENAYGQGKTAREAIDAAIKGLTPAGGDR